MGALLEQCQLGGGVWAHYCSRYTSRYTSTQVFCSPGSTTRPPTCMPGLCAHTTMSGGGGGGGVKPNIMSKASCFENTEGVFL